VKTWKAALWVAVGGFLGTLSRASMDGAWVQADPTPWGILAVNLLGATALGFVVGHGLPRLSPHLREGLTVGFLGSFTTFSAISVIWLGLTVEGSVLTALGYLVATFGAGIPLALVGGRAGRAIATRKRSP
jgi:fluoride exporter